jgi:hypothetical protein
MHTGELYLQGKLECTRASLWSFFPWHHAPPRRGSMCSAKAANA